MRSNRPVETLLIVGASPRAAAQSARRAGLQPVCIASFEDEDLTATARTVAWPRNLKELIRLAESLPPGPWMYTGALENRPGLIDAISRSRRLWGNPGEVVRAVRNPVRVAHLLRKRGLPALDVRDVSEPPDDGDWLMKPMGGAGGAGIKPWRTASAIRRPLRSIYFQRWVTGASLAAVFLADGQSAQLAGLSWQLVGLCSSHAPPFAYCGSIGPVFAADRDQKGTGASPSREAMIPSETYRQIEQIGEAIAIAFGLRGLFGCDLVWDGHTVWLTEVNPRYTASVEVLEHAFQRSLLESHRHVFEPDDRNGPIQRRPPVSVSGEPSETEANLQVGSVHRFVGKQILYAPRSMVAPPMEDVRQTEQGDAVPPLADVPAPGTPILAGQPICTVLAQADTLPACWERLCERVEKVWDRLTVKP